MPKSELHLSASHQLGLLRHLPLAIKFVYALRLYEDLNFIKVKLIVCDDSRNDFPTIVNNSQPVEKWHQVSQLRVILAAVPSLNRQCSILIKLKILDGRVNHDDVLFVSAKDVVVEVVSQLTCALPAYIVLDYAIWVNNAHNFLQELL